MTTSPKQSDGQRPAVFFALNPETDKFEEVFIESELPDDCEITPMFWSDRGYMSVPGTEFQAKDFGDRLESWQPRSSKV